MSDYFARAKHPETGNSEFVWMMDDYFGPHQYGIMFGDGAIYPPKFVEMLPELDERRKPPKGE